MKAMDDEVDTSQNASHPYDTDIPPIDTQSFHCDTLLTDRSKIGEKCDRSDSSTSLPTRTSSRETLPKIMPNMSAWASFSSESTNVQSSVTPSSSVSMSQSGDLGVHLPDIQSNSFLIQVPQGMNNERRKVDNSFSRKPILRLHNDLTESSVGSSFETVSTDRQRLGDVVSPSFVPRPPSTEVPNSRVVSRP